MEGGGQPFWLRLQLCHRRHCHSRRAFHNAILIMPGIACDALRLLISPRLQACHMASYIPMSGEAPMLA